MGLLNEKEWRDMGHGRSEENRRPRPPYVHAYVGPKSRGNELAKTGRENETRKLKREGKPGALPEKHAHAPQRKERTI